ncbi:MAG: hypothetical protein CFE31_18940 [Rhizobiales bacterium PAR1]|nr:MAG: hypothetical protein CFE31_18940 [Rhizobiales bacterium PAR1]
MVDDAVIPTDPGIALGFRRSPRPRTLWSAASDDLSTKVTVPSIQVFDPREARQKFRAENGTEVPLAAAGLASHSQRDRCLIDMATDDRNGYRTLAIATSEIVTRLEALSVEMPNCADALAPIVSAAKASLNSQTPLKLAPMLLVGAPGTGKTRFMNKVAGILGPGYCRLSMPSLSGAQPLSGTDLTWKSPRPGKVLTTLMRGKDANIVIGLDEIDKVFANQPGESPLDILHELWESESAREFVDDCVGLKIDASAIVWLATANNLDGIRPSILDRADIIEIPLPDRHQMTVIICQLYRELAAHWPDWFEADVSSVIIDMLAAQHPRLARRLLQSAMIGAVARGARSVGEIDLAGEISGKMKGSKPRIGFF